MQSKKPLPNPPLPETNDLASANECTGLMPTPATEPSELDSYSDIYDIPLTESPKEQFEDQTHYPERP